MKLVDPPLPGLSHYGSIERQRDRSDAVVTISIGIWPAIAAAEVLRQATAFGLSASRLALAVRIDNIERL